MTYGVARALVVAVGVSLHAGCAGLNKSSYFDRFVLHPDMKNVASSAQAQLPAPPSSDTLEEAIGKVRHLMATAKPEPKPQAATLESQDPELTTALAAAVALPSPEHYVAVGALYHRRGLLDKAYDYHRLALRLNKRHADAYEGLARVWRDWHAPELGLSDAHRAIFYSPTSAPAHNTLGTLLQALGQRDEARKAYLRATFLDPNAAYAFNNLCYLSYAEGRPQQAIAECQTALRLNPAMIAARNNLGLAYASIGRPDLARSEFAMAAGPVATAYNMGMAYLSQSRFSEAAREFETAQSLNPTFAEASRRATYARRMAGQTGESKSHDTLN